MPATMANWVKRSSRLASLGSRYPSVVQAESRTSPPKRTRIGRGVKPLERMDAAFTAAQASPEVLHAATQRGHHADTRDDYTSFHGSRIR